MIWRRDAIGEIRERAERVHPVELVVDTLAAVAEMAGPEWLVRAVGQDHASTSQDCSRY